MSHSFLIEVTEVPWSHDLRENYLCSTAECIIASARQLWRSPGSGVSETVHKASVSHLLKKLKRFSSRVTRLGSLKKPTGQNLNCAVMVGITVRQCCQLCREPDSLRPPSAELLLPQGAKVCEVRMKLCRFWTETDKLLYSSFKSKFWESVCFPIICCFW